MNRRPSGYEPDELPDCSIPRLCGGILQRNASLSSNHLKNCFFFNWLAICPGRDAAWSHAVRASALLYVVLVTRWEAFVFGKSFALMSVRRLRE